MKKFVLVLGVLLVLLLSGCISEFTTGAATGAAIMNELNDDAQDSFIKAVNELNAETDKLNTQIDAVKKVNVKDFIKPETIEAFNSLKTNRKDPMTWISLISVLGAAFFGGKIHERRNGS